MSDLYRRIETALDTDPLKLRDALAEVLALHRSEPGPDGEPVCWKCRGRGNDWPDEWPCGTVRAIEEALS